MKREKSICCKSTHMPGCQDFFIQTFLEKKFSSLYVTAFFHFSAFNNPVSPLTALLKEPSTNYQLANPMSLFLVRQLHILSVFHFSHPSKDIRHKLYFCAPVIPHSPGLPFTHPLIFICKHIFIWDSIIFQIYLWASPCPNRTYMMGEMERNVKEINKHKNKAM